MPVNVPGKTGGGSTDTGHSAETGAKATYRLSLRYRIQLCILFPFDRYFFSPLISIHCFGHPFPEHHGRRVEIPVPDHVYGVNHEEGDILDAHVADIEEIGRSVVVEGSEAAASTPFLRPRLWSISLTT